MAARDSYRGSQNHSHRSDNSGYSGRQANSSYSSDRQGRHSSGSEHSSDQGRRSSVPARSSSPARSSGNYSGSSRGSGQRRFNDEPRESTLNELTSHLHAIDGRSYAAYKAIVGRYRSPLGWVLYIDRIQPDPYAPPTAIRVVLPLALTGADARLTGTDTHLTETDSHLTGADTRPTGTNAPLSGPDPRLTESDPRPTGAAEHLTGAAACLTASSTRAVALRDYLARTLRELLKGQAISIAPAGQEILERSSVNLHETWQDDFSTPAFNAPGPYLELRLRWSLPAFGREIAGRQAARNLNLDLARAVAGLDLRESELGAEAWKHCQVAEDHAALQEILVERGWVAFLADGANLARRSGVSQLPLEGGVPLTAPETLAQTVQLPHAGVVRGTAIPAGVTVIAGGGYHGKSTLLNAIARGIYPHIPGDGRELVATVPEAMAVRAADGRAVTGVDLRPFISHLPGRDADPAQFTTANASGSTSQAASIMESLELWGQPAQAALLLDEDTCATNLLIRDQRMRALVSSEREPITPLVDRIRALHRERGISTLIVMGGSGDYLDVADQVLIMDSYRLVDATAQARQVCDSQPRMDTSLPDFPLPAQRLPQRPEAKRRGPSRTRALGTQRLVLDRHEVDVADVSGLVDEGQALAVAWALRALLERHFDGRTSLSQALAQVAKRLDDVGLDALGEAHPAFLVRPRLVDVGAAVNRLRSLQVNPGA
ncbi:MAG: ABC-ATPase domain-containing protein [Actinomyces graevenitzii]|uniref:ABC-ATPase domain-containing protein n=1 Tax=Actinomyces graevenitzii TaxID=55565 RepID=A0A9E7AMD0_9ACTO|nr:MAG: ABC-ATPase domain-containing protein [Actinomyces graevenitzii]